MKKMRAAAAGAVLILIFASLSLLAPVNANNGSVAIQGFAFRPSSLSLFAPATVTWNHQDPGVPHTVTSDSGLFNSGTMSQGSFSFTFTVPGTYSYRCAIHTFMTGEVVVSAPSSPDLYVQTISDSATLPSSRQISVTVANSGLVPAGSFGIQLGYIYKGNFRPLTLFSSSGLAASSSQSFTFMWDAAGKVGNFLIRATADSANQVAEADETNNSADKAVTIGAPVSPGIDLFEP